MCTNICEQCQERGQLDLGSGPVELPRIYATTPQPKLWKRLHDGPSLGQNVLRMPRPACQVMGNADPAAKELESSPVSSLFQ